MPAGMSGKRCYRVIIRHVMKWSSNDIDGAPQTTTTATTAIITTIIATTTVTIIVVAIVGCGDIIIVVVVGMVGVGVVQRGHEGKHQSG